MLTNNKNIINNVRVIPGISDHDIVLFEVNLALRKEKPVKRKFYIRKRADNTRIKKELQEFVNDFEVMKNESVDAKWNMFQQRLTGIMTIMDCCMPHKFTTSRHNLPWFNRSLR